MSMYGVRRVRLTTDGEKLIGPLPIVYFAPSRIKFTRRRPGQIGRYRLQTAGQRAAPASLIVSLVPAPGGADVNVTATPAAI